MSSRHSSSRRREDESRKSDRRRDSEQRSAGDRDHRVSPRTKRRRDGPDHDRSREMPPPHPPVKIKEEPQSEDEGDRRRRKSPRRKHPTEEDEAKNYTYGKQQVKVEKEDEDGPPVEKQRPNFGLSGKLTEEKNVFNGVVVKYSEPPEARTPKRRWRFYVFKGEETLPTLYLHRQSAYLMGRDRLVADIPIDHPSCSKQHAVLQFRLVNYDRPDGSTGRTVRPYIIDLEAANGTYVNNQKIEAKRYVELFEKDVLKFGFSSREYVLLHEDSKAEAGQDDLGQ